MLDGRLQCHDQRTVILRFDGKLLRFLMLTQVEGNGGVAFQSDAFDFRIFKQTVLTCAFQKLLVRQKGSIGVLPQKISCDYYDFMLGKESAVKSFRGEYMAQYSWGENTLSFLNRMAGKNAGH